ncbi:MAG: glycosyltransferase family 2 protein [Chitinophagaceae bacterium]
MADLSIIVPVFNEADFILPFYYELRKHVPDDFELIWVNDGSTDSTLFEIEQLTNKDNRIKCICLTKNFGKTNAISAGLDYAEGRRILVMSGNLYHPPVLIPQLLGKMDEGFDIVTAEVSNSKALSDPLRIFLNSYYKLLKKIAPQKNKIDFTAYRIMNHKVADALHQMKIKNHFIFDFYTWADFRNTTLAFENPVCKEKEKKYSFRNLIYETRNALNNLYSETIHSLLVAGYGSVFAGIVLFVVLTITGLNNLPLAIISAAFLLGGIQLIIFSSWKKRWNRIVKSSIQGTHYRIKDIIENESNVLEYQTEMKESF